MKMNEIYQKALSGTLQSRNTGQSAQFSFTNQTEIPLGVYLVSDHGVWMGMVPGGSNQFGFGYPSLLVKPGKTWPGFTGQIDYGWYFLFVNYYSGAFAAVLQAASGGSDPQNWVTVTCSDLLDPNGIGTPPTPNQAVVIPPDSPRVVVGCGQSGKNRIAREQYWRRLPKSYCIAKGEHRTENYTTTAGIETTTSEQSKLAVALGMDASAGWGPISAGISTSISASSSRLQQVSTNTQTTSFVSQEFDNSAGGDAQLFLYWQLTNVVTVFDSDGTALSSLIYGAEEPAVIDGPYNPAKLPKRPLAKTSPMSDRMRALLAGDGAG
ncbi:MULTISPECIES: hypothetical protein [unclassified Streptomyces]|uniref:hypothetical protein n=1 Tax=unclassified Streptomyces TaxID=2593676 RepID=UPI002E303B1D|nr:hypothetical protein [Streptomyces sp. NBC_01268]